MLSISRICLVSSIGADISIREQSIHRHFAVRVRSPETIFIRPIHSAQEKAGGSSDMNSALPKRLGAYIHHTGIRALDHLSENVVSPEEGTTPDAVQTLVGHWRSMNADEKEEFVNRVATSVGEVIAASALLPVGLKVEGKAVKSARKVLKRSSRELKKRLRATEKKKPKVAKGKTGGKRGVEKIGKSAGKKGKRGDP